MSNKRREPRRPRRIRHFIRCSIYVYENIRNRDYISRLGTRVSLIKGGKNRRVGAEKCLSSPEVHLPSKYIARRKAGKGGGVMRVFFYCARNWSDEPLSWKVFGYAPMTVYLLIRRYELFNFELRTR